MWSVSEGTVTSWALAVSTATYNLWAFGTSILDAGRTLAYFNAEPPYCLANLTPKYRELFANAHFRSREQTTSHILARQLFGYFITRGLYCTRQFH